jgi:type II secretory pathway pseudopilin PulG
MNQDVKNFIKKIKSDKFTVSDLEVLSEVIETYLSDKDEATTQSQYKTFEDFENAAHSFMVDLYEDDELKVFMASLRKCGADFAEKEKLLSNIQQNIRVAAETRDELNNIQMGDEDDADATTSSATRAATTSIRNAGAAGRKTK